MRRRHFMREIGRACAVVPLVPTMLRQTAKTSAAQSARSDQTGGPPWQPDGWGSLGRIGILLPAGDAVPESEFSAMAPQGVSIHASPAPLRLLLADQRGRPVGAGAAGADAVLEFAQSPKLDEAAELLARAPLNVIAYCFTSSSYSLGAAGDAALKDRLEKQTRGIPVVITSPSVVLALRALRARRLAIIHPPWFAADLDRRGAEYFRRQGFDVVYHEPAALQFSYGGVDGPQLYDWARAKVPKEADAVFVGGNGFRAVGAIRALEVALGRPMLTANQTVFWHAIRLGGLRATVDGYGQLFSRDLPPG